MGRLQKSYAQTQKVRICPMAPDPYPSAWVQRTEAAYAGFGLADYPWNWDVFGPAGANDHGGYGINSSAYSSSSPGPQDFQKETGVTKPTLTPYFSDSNWVDGGIEPTDTPARNLYSGGDNNGMERITIARHGGKGPAAAPRSVPMGATLVGRNNVGFADGHVEAVRLENLWNLYWNKNWVIPSPRPR
jgi:prepilin-type processing-associated H-X9-DG protein